MFGLKHNGIGTARAYNHDFSCHGAKPTVVSYIMFSPITQKLLKLVSIAIG
jgi:hypothetical protein